MQTLNYNHRGRNSWFTFLVLALGGLVFSSSAVWAQAGAGQQQRQTTSGSYSIRGKVYLPSGYTPERRLRVVLEIATGGIVSEIFTDSAGNFEFRALPGGNYLIKVPTDNQTYESGQEQVELSGFSRAYSAQIFLRERSVDRNAPTNRMLSVADTQEVPANAKKLFEKAGKLVKDNKLQAAVEQYQAALSIFPDYLHALHKLGELFMQRGQPFDAQLNFERALTVNNRFALPHIGLGTLLFGQGKVAEAIGHFESALNEDESYPVAHINLGLALMELKPPDYTRSEKELMRGMALMGKEGLFVRLHLFNLHLRQRHYPQAASELERFLQEKPEAPEAPQIRQKLEALKKVMAQAANQSPAAAPPAKP